MSYPSILQRRSTAADKTLVIADDGGKRCVKDIFLASIEGDVECIEANLACGVDVNKPGQPAKIWGPRFEKSGLFSATPLHYAVSYGREEAVRALLKLGARTDLRSASGMTAKQYAQRRQYNNIVHLIDSHVLGMAAAPLGVP
jgi:ankyrin repeat protein